MDSRFITDDLNILLSYIADLMNNHDYKTLRRLLRRNQLCKNLNARYLNKKFNDVASGYKFMRRHERLCFEKYYYTSLNYEQPIMIKQF